MADTYASGFFGYDNDNFYYNIELSDGSKCRFCSSTKTFSNWCKDFRQVCFCDLETIEKRLTELGYDFVSRFVPDEKNTPKSCLVKVVKIPCIGEQLLVMGILKPNKCYDLYQLFTLEGYEEFDKEHNLNLYEKRGKYRGKTIQFDSVGEIEIVKSPHAFSFDKIDGREISETDMPKLLKEMFDDDWYFFDDETWGK